MADIVKCSNPSNGGDSQDGASTISSNSGQKRVNDGKDGNGKKAKSEDKPPRLINILVRRIKDPDDNTIAFFVYNGFVFRDDITQNAGRPAAGYVSFQHVRSHTTLINPNEEQRFITTNFTTSQQTISIAPILLLSDAERAFFNLRPQFVQGGH